MLEEAIQWVEMPYGTKAVQFLTLLVARFNKGQILCRPKIIALLLKSRLYDLKPETLLLTPSCFWTPKKRKPKGVPCLPYVFHELRVIQSIIAESGVLIGSKGC